ncbi:MBL fold metallo-hydrolase [Alicyclobacillus sp. SO9]|uniref:MBL fold metallo-hydrolase n=1 Tax=Alicyclobacillus sp. SO9 TaxID=2665646 RepID=UPI0018E740F0|nr:MBL fold metallo-hydrolase [Alicyclobacillus sp. SO9]QQE77223.1 MBL fold metallo-hydrolase [Alicyclobacillus sp. SO9]
MTESTSTQKMPVPKVFEEIMDHKPLFILDVRNEEDYGDWKIEGDAVTSINVPYFDLLDDLKPLDEKLPEDQSVLVVCAKEGSSEYVAEQLREEGRTDVFVMEGGMKGWSQYLHPVKAGDLPNGGSLYQFVRVGKGCLSYMIVSGKQALVVDAARMTDVYEHFAKDLGVSIEHVVDTHLHADHISGGRKLAASTGARYWLPPGDAERVTYDYTQLADGTTLSVGSSGVKVRALATPGHTSGSTSIVVDDKYLLSGDTLFVQSIGRPDLAGKAGEWALDLYSSLHETYHNLSPDLHVLPAHFATTGELDDSGRVMARLGTLFERNSSLGVDDKAEFERMVTENLPPQPNAYREIREVNMGQLEVDDSAKLEEMEIGPNRCAVSD